VATVILKIFSNMIEKFTKAQSLGQKIISTVQYNRRFKINPVKLEHGIMYLMGRTDVKTNFIDISNF
jgi:hypothetical protein